MEEYDNKDIIEKLNKPIFSKIIRPNKHLIFVKYSNQRYYKYIFELLDSLVQKSLFSQKRKIFHTSLYYLLKILHNCGNVPYCSNLDLIILSCFFLGIKTVENQKKMINITKLKNIYPEKYSSYENAEIKDCEMTCIYLLKYDINFLTVYDCICFLLENCDENEKNEIITEFEKKILNNGVNFYIYENPLTLAQGVINEIKQVKGKSSPNAILTKKKIPKKLTCNNLANYNKIINFNFGNEESLSTSASFGSGQNSNNKPSRNINLIVEKNINNFKKISIPNNKNHSKLMQYLENNNNFNSKNSKYLTNHNTRYSINKNPLTKSICFVDNNNNKHTHLVNSMGNNFYYNQNKSGEINYNINHSNIYNYKNSFSNIELEKLNLSNNKNIFRKPLIKTVTTNNKIINVKKSCNLKKNNIYKYKKNNYNGNINEINTNNNFSIINHFSDLHKKINEYIGLNPTNNSSEKYTKKEFKYKNISKIRSKSILRRYINQ